MTCSRDVKGCEVYSIKEVQVHDGYVSSNGQYDDIALITLDASSTITPIPLLTSEKERQYVKPDSLEVYTTSRIVA